MKCPGCGMWVQDTDSHCPHCGVDFATLQAIDEIQVSVRRTRGEVDLLRNRIIHLDEQVSSLRPRMHSKPVMPSSASPPPPRVDVPGPQVEQSGVDVPFVEELTDRLRAKVPRLHSVMSPVKRRETHPVISNESEVRFGQKWLLIIGIAITVLSVGYFLKYSFDRNWIGPAGRVAMAYFAGVATLALGEWLTRRKLEQFGLYLVGGSVAIFYFACYAAFQIYGLLNQPTAFVLMVVVTFFAGLLSLLHDTKWLAVLGIVGGFLTPVVLSTGADNQIALMTYMAILNAGILAIATFKQWNLLNRLGMVCTWALFSAWFWKYYTDVKFWPTAIYLNAFFLTYALAPFVYFIPRRHTGSVTGFNITLPNTAIAFGYSFATIRSYFSLQSVGVVTGGYAVIFFAMAYYLYRRNRENVEAIVLLVAKSLLFSILTVPIIFSEHWITLFWTAQGIVLIWAALRLSDARLRVGGIVLVLVSCAKLFFVDYPGHFGLHIIDISFAGGFAELLWERCMTSGVTLAALFMAGDMLKDAGLDGSCDEKEYLCSIFYTVFGVALFGVLNIELAAYFHDAAPQARFASISALWALYASGLMTLGFARNSVTLRRTAIVLFGITVGKVFLYDMANVETPYRILSFLVVGLLLVAASYLYHRYSARILGTAVDSR